jgi:bacteriorhodopsin
MIANIIFSVLNLVIMIAIPLLLLWIALTLRGISKKLEGQATVKAAEARPQAIASQTHPVPENETTTTIKTVSPKGQESS